MKCLLCSLLKAATQPIIAVSCSLRQGNSGYGDRRLHAALYRPCILSLHEENPPPVNSETLLLRRTHCSFWMVLPAKMWKYNSSKFITSHADAHSLTHFLAIPLLSPASRPAFRNSITRFLDDPSAASVPRHDLRPLGTLHLRVGTMNLTKPERFAQSIEILRTLNFKNILEVAATGSNREVADNAERIWREASPLTMRPISSAPRTGVAPLSVSVRGLHSGVIGMEAEAISLSTNVIDLTRRLKPLIDITRNAYREAGLLYLRRFPDVETNRLRQENEASSTFSMTLLQSINHQSQIIPDFKLRGKLRQTPLPRYDFRDIINQYKDKTWSDEIRLDRVSICQMGLAGNLRRHGGGIDSDLGLSEVFSVPLP